MGDDSECLLQGHPSLILRHHVKKSASLIGTNNPSARRRSYEGEGPWGEGERERERDSVSINKVKNGLRKTLHSS